MRFFSLVAPVITAFAALVAAGTENAISFPYSQISLNAGQTLNIKWNPTTQAPVTLRLRSGASNNLSDGITIVSNTPNDGAYSYPIPKSTPYSAYYTIEIIYGPNPDDVNYSGTFVINSSAMGSTMMTSSTAASSSAMVTSHAQTHTKPKVVLGHSQTSTAQFAGVTHIGGNGVAAGLDVRGGGVAAAIMAVGAGVAIAL